MAERNIALETENLNKYASAHGGQTPTLAEDWKSVFTATYGTDLPPELANLEMFKASNPAQVPTPTPTVTPSPLPAGPSGLYRG